MSEGWPAYPVPSGFSADPAVSPGLRASHADRMHAAALLHDAHVAGRITEVELAERTRAVDASLTLGDLAPLVADVVVPTAASPASPRLPAAYEPPPWPVRPPATPRPLTPLVVFWGAVALACTLVWLLAAPGTERPLFWPVWVVLAGVVSVGARVIRNARLGLTRDDVADDEPPGPVG